MLTVIRYHISSMTFKTMLLLVALTTHLLSFGMDWMEEFL